MQEETEEEVQSEATEAEAEETPAAEATEATEAESKLPRDPDGMVVPSEAYKDPMRDPRIEMQGRPGPLAPN